MTEKEKFIELANYRMPFGKYKGRRLLELPDAYYVWFMNKGLPSGKLGRLMKSAYEIRVNGLEYLFDKFVSYEDAFSGNIGKHAENDVITKSSAYATTAPNTSAIAI